MKNMLSVVGSIVSMSGEHRPEARDFVTSIQARLGSLAATHELLTQADGRPIALGRLFEKVLAPLGVLERIDASGDRDFLLGAHDAQTLALVMHELATNAIKYGALSNGAGRVAVTFEVKIDGRPGEQPLPPGFSDEIADADRSRLRPHAARAADTAQLTGGASVRMARRRPLLLLLFAHRAGRPLAAQASVSGASPLR